MHARINLTGKIVLIFLLALIFAGCRAAEQPVVTEQATTAPTTAPEEQPTSTPQVEPAPITLAPQGTPYETYYAPFPVNITVDGEMEDWQGVPMVSIPENADQITGATSIRFAAAANDKYLYLLGDVTDPKIVTGQHGTDYWNEDSVEFYINASGNLEANTYSSGIVQMTVPPLNIGASVLGTVIGGINGDTVDPILQVVETESGYRVEMAVPLENSDVWNIDVLHGNVIGFQVHLNAASESDRNKKVIWSKFDVSDSSYFDPRVFGELIFYEVGQQTAARIEPEGPPEPEIIAVPENPLYLQSDASPAERAEDLIQYMTLAEKIGQMTLVEKDSIIEEDIRDLYIGGLLSGGGGSPSRNTPEAWAEMVDGFQEYALESHLGIPMIYGVDAVHGHANVRGAVVFPHNIGLGAAADPELMERIGRATALEMIATGIYWNYAPAVSVPQDVRWGRTYEGYSEDTDLVSLLSAAYIRGLQGDSLAAENSVLATPKHYVGDGGTSWGTSTTGDYKIDQGVTEIDEETLRAIHLPPYISAIEAGAKSIMISYSSWGGVKMHGQDYLINDVLKNELGFDGFIVSDWGGMDQITPNYYDSVVAGINAGIDMNMVPYEYIRFINTLTEAVEKGDVPMERIDDAVLRILTVKFEMGLFEHPFSNPDYIELVGSDQHREIAREAVQKSLVLLKNENDLLPLSKETPQLFVGGFAADDIGIQSGGWTIEWQGKEGAITPGTTFIDALNSTLGNTKIEFSENGSFTGDPGAEGAVCLAFVGETPYAEGMGDSDRLALPPRELKALTQMEEACSNLAVVIISGRPVDIADRLENWDALVAAFLPGTEGQGVIDVLIGDAPFSGKLPVTWFGDPADTVSKDAPLFPLGFGLGTE